MADDQAKLLIEISPNTYKISEGGRDIIYLMLKKALNGCMKSALLFTSVWKIDQLRLQVKPV
jgi:hypothetical protein